LGRGQTYSAYLVQSKRVDCKPRQETLAFLGNLSIYTISTHLNERLRQDFLRKAMKRLTNSRRYLRQVEDQRKAVEEALERKTAQFIEDELKFRRSAVIGTTVSFTALQRQAREAREMEKGCNF
jgi:hypothetical protein